MNHPKHTIKRTILAAAVTTALGTASQSMALDLEFSFTGLFTMINSTGAGALNNTDAGGGPWYGFRTPVVGTLFFDTATNTGSMSIDPFSFFGSGNATATSITFADTDGLGAGTQLLANMGFDWNANIGIPVSLVWEADGLLDAIGTGLTVGNTIGPDGSTMECEGTGTDIDISCALTATDGFGFDFGALGTYTLPIGQVPLATTTFNTSTIGGASCTLGCNPSGTLPLSDDGVGGNPMAAGPFPGFNANFDFTSLTLLSDGFGAITAPAPVDDTAPQVPGPPTTQSVDLGVPPVVTPAGTAEYCTETIAVCNAGTGTDNWVASGTTGANNPIDVPINQTLNESVVDWRAGGGAAFATQAVKVTVADTIPPVIDTMPANMVVDIATTEPPTEVCFTDGGISLTDLTASDVWDAAPTIEWSLDGFFPGNPNNLDPPGNCSSEFGVNDNIVTWRATDTAGNFTEYEQTVTMRLTEGIVGTDCVVDLDTTGDRLVEGRFIMRGASGGQTGVTDTTVAGRLDPTLLCTDEDTCTLDGAAWGTDQAFFGSLWSATPVRLFGENVPNPSWTFEACPGDDGSTLCTTPTPLSMTSVGPGQLAAHMLFEWNNNLDIDVVVVWDVNCGEYTLVASDPDGDGVIGTLMVDGPFKGFNAAFDLRAVPGQVPFAQGGFTTTIPAYKNPISGGSPPALDNLEMVEGDFPNDPAAVTSCVGGCNKFVDVPTSVDATDDGGAYKQALVVLPLRDNEVIPFWSKFRKFDGVEWRDFVINGRNTVESSLRNEDGSCPEPGSDDYTPAAVHDLENKLEFGHGCIQLSIEDDGPNDADDTTPGVVADDSGVAQVAAPPAPEAATTGSDGGTGGCSLATTSIDPAKRADWTLMGGLLAVLGFFSLRRRRKQRH